MASLHYRADNLIHFQFRHMYRYDTTDGMRGSEFNVAVKHMPASILLQIPWLWSCGDLWVQFYVVSAFVGTEYCARGRRDSTPANQSLAARGSRCRIDELRMISGLQSVH